MHTTGVEIDTLRDPVKTGSINVRVWRLGYDRDRRKAPA